MCSTHPFLQLRHCNCLGPGLATSRDSVQVQGQELHEDVEDVLRESLRKVVREVLFAGDVLHAEMALADSVCEPKITHVHTLGSLFIELVVGETQGDSVVDAEQSRRLRIAEVRQRVAVLHCTLGGHEC